MHVMPHGPVGCGVEEDNHESREFGLNPVWCGWLNPLRVYFECASCVHGSCQKDATGDLRN
jgi:hypothetical protein